jgi:DNA repair photolyase
MADVVVRSAFTAKTPEGARVMKKGEAFRLSSRKAVSLVLQGLAVDANIGLDLLAKYEARVKVLIEKLSYTLEEAQNEAAALVKSCLLRHDSLKNTAPPTAEFIAEVEEFNTATKGKPRPINKEQASTGVGEWAGYKCNIGVGCSHGCLYCYAEKMAVRFGRVGDAESWKVEHLKELSSAGCKKYDTPIMFPTSHDITPAYFAAYRYHLFNMLTAGNQVLIVTKPHQECIEGICSLFSAYRDQITFRFTIGGLDNQTMMHWEPGAPPVTERIRCLQLAFEKGFTTSVSAEPMLGGKEDAVNLYYRLEPFITEEIWFGKMNNIGSLRSSTEPEVAKKATELMALQSDKEIMTLVDLLGGLPKVQWKDSIKAIIAKEKGEKK